MTPTTLSQVFKNIKDPRIARAQRHPLINIITIAICSVICGADNFVAMTEFGRSKKAWQWLNLGLNDVTIPVINQGAGFSKARNNHI